MSKHSVAIQLLDLTDDYTLVPDIEFIKLYSKLTFLTQINNDGTVRDVVLDRPLDNFIPGPVAAIVATDTVLEAFEKLQATVTFIGANYLQLVNYRAGRILEATNATEGVSPIPGTGSPDHVDGSFVIKILTNDIVEYWEMESGLFLLRRTIRPVVLDGNRVNIIRDFISPIEGTNPPSAGDITTPINGDTALIGNGVPVHL